MIGVTQKITDKSRMTTIYVYLGESEDLREERSAGVCELSQPQRLEQLASLPELDVFT